MSEAKHHKMETFKERRGKYTFSVSPFPVPLVDNFHLNMRNNHFKYIGMEKEGFKKSIFSITATDDNKHIYFDMENCEVYPLGYVDKITKDKRRYQNVTNNSSIITTALLASEFILLVVLFT